MKRPAPIITVSTTTSSVCHAIMTPSLISVCSSDTTLTCWKVKFPSVSLKFASFLKQTFDTPQSIFLTHQ